MKKLLSINYSQGAFNVAILFLRIGLGALMLPHGYQKLVKFSSMKNTFMDFLGMGSTMSLSLTIFAEFFCSLFLIFGLFSRLVVIPLIVAMSVAVFIAHNHDFFGKGELATIYLIGFFTILLVGPGKISVDGMINK
ncbi:MAG: DoxX family protein [Chitinophagaceae bacterium]|nr:MAG: DoxX family protein [Chitinophagaceae bacterium]